MIGGEHKKERFSERLQGAQNQPKNRGYIPGTAMMTGGYTTNTFAGNWAEEHADMGFYDGLPALPTEQEKFWQTTYRAMTGKPTSVGTKKNDLSQETLMEIVDHTRSRYPGHQPHADPHIEEVLRDNFLTTFKETYLEPKVAKAKEDANVAPALGGLPDSQARGVMLRLRRQLELTMPGQSAFPGNVARTVRHALQLSCTDRSGEINVEELLDGFQAAGIKACEAECRALVRCFCEKQTHTASLQTLVNALRGELTDRREQLIRNVYKLLESIAEKGIVRVGLMVDLIDVAQLPRVKACEVHASEARKAFREQWDARNDSEYVDLDRFITFFGDGSFEIATDNDFELLMRNIWHLSGGNERCANTSCQRVEIVHLTGRVTEEEIKNDLTIRGTGPEAERQMMENLARQGIKDIKSMRLLPRS
eukprot:gene4142-2984_t